MPHHVYNASATNFSRREVLVFLAYAFTLHGTLFLPNGSTLLIDGIAKATYDGKGNFTQVDAVADNGLLTPGWRPGSGTYSVNADCTGTGTISVPGLADLHVQFIVAQGGNTIHQVVIDPGFATTAEGELLAAPKDADLDWRLREAVIPE